MRIAAYCFALIALLFGQATSVSAFSKDIAVTAVNFSSNFDTATITLSRNPGEKVTVLYDLYIGDSTSAHAAAGTSQFGQMVTLSGLRNNFEQLGGPGTRFRLQWRACPYEEPYVNQNEYRYCSREFVQYITYQPSGTSSSFPTSFLIKKATISADHDFITVELSSSAPEGYILYERTGRVDGFDYTGLQFRADNTKTVILPVRDDFETSGTSGKQTITLRPCVDAWVERDGITSCGPRYPLTIDLSGPLSFSDVRDTHPNADAIRYVQKQGIVAGYADGKFWPDYDINRAEFTKLVTLYTFGQGMIDQCATRVRLSDVPKDAWYLRYICRAQDAQLIGGYPDGTFRPGNSINIAEAAKIIALADSFGSLEEVLFIPSSGRWYEPYVRYLAERNAIPTSIEKLDANLTRGEMAEIIYRLRAGVTDKPSKTYEQFVTSEQSSFNVQYKLIGLPSKTVKNYSRNIVYRYAIIAPLNANAEINGQAFGLIGGRWSGPQLSIFSDASYTNQIDTWASDDNYGAHHESLGDMTTLQGTLVIPPSQTRYLQLTVNIGTPADLATMQVKQANLPQVTLTVSE